MEFSPRTQSNTAAVKVNYIIFLLLSLYPVCTAGFIAAESEFPRKESTAELQVDPEFQPELGTYFYDVYWRDVRVGKATITTTLTDDLYHVIVKAKTASKINLFYKFRYKGEVKMDSFPLRPRIAEVQENAGRKQKNIEIKFPQEDRAEALEVESIGGKTKTISEKSATSDTFILDPFSIVFLVRHLDWHVGMAEIFDVFTGTKQYELTLLCSATKIKSIAGDEREAWVILPQTREISASHSEVKSEFTVYVSKDTKKEILKIEGAPRIGRVEARLRQFAPEDYQN